MKLPVILPDLKESVIVGVSGGSDSLVLLHLLVQKYPKVVVAHVNYHLRPESDLEEQLVKNYCTKLNVHLEVLSAPTIKSGNIQHQARQIRMNFFLDLAKRFASKSLFLAHHLDDHLETYLWQKEKKVTPDFFGLIYQRQFQNITIYRPLLSIFKQDIIDYARIHNISYATDASNFTPKYTRNKIRLQLSKYNKIQKLALYEEIDQVNKQLNQNKINIATNNLTIATFKALPVEHQHQLLINLSKPALDYYLSKHRLEDICQKLLSKNAYIKIELNSDWFIEKSYGNINLVQVSNNTFSYRFTGQDLQTQTHLFSLNKLDSNFAISSESLPLIIASANLDDKILFNNKLVDLATFFRKKRVPHQIRRETFVVKSAAGIIIFIPSLYQQIFLHPIYVYFKSIAGKGTGNALGD